MPPPIPKLCDLAPVAANEFMYKIEVGEADPVEVVEAFLHCDCGHCSLPNFNHVPRAPRRRRRGRSALPRSEWHRGMALIARLGYDDDDDAGSVQRYERRRGKARARASQRVKGRARARPGRQLPHGSDGRQAARSPNTPC